jgi:hypothetical protein
VFCSKTKARPGCGKKSAGDRPRNRSCSISRRNWVPASLGIDPGLVLGTPGTGAGPDRQNWPSHGCLWSAGAGAGAEGDSGPVLAYPVSAAVLAQAWQPSLPSVATVSLMAVKRNYGKHGDVRLTAALSDKCPVARARFSHSTALLFRPRDEPVALGPGHTAEYKIPGTPSPLPRVSYTTVFPGAGATRKSRPEWSDVLCENRARRLKNGWWRQ